MPVKAKKAPRKKGGAAADAPAAPVTPARALCEPVHATAGTIFEWFVNAWTLVAERERGELVTAGAMGAWARCRRAHTELLTVVDKDAARQTALEWVLSDWAATQGGAPKHTYTVADIGGGEGPTVREQAAAAAAAVQARAAEDAHAPPAAAAEAEETPPAPTESQHVDPALPVECEEACAEGDLWGWRRGHGDSAAAREGERVGDLLLSRVCLSYDGVELLANAQVRVLQGHRYGLVGRNGCGKTTLMRSIARGALPGLPRHLRAWYVQQELRASEVTCVAAVMAADAERTALLEEEARLEADDGGTDDAAADAQRLACIQERLDDISAHDAEERARQVLRGLQFTQTMIDGPTSALSGGWRQRVALAQALYMRSRLDVLLLDEPTNHLDLPAVLWLERLLAEDSEGLTVVIVSHDTAFLDGVVTDIMHLDHHTKKVEYFPGTHSAWVEMCEDRGRRDTVRLAAAEKQEKKAKAFIDKQRSLANSKHRDDNKQRQAAERIKKMERVSRMGIGGAHQRGQKVALCVQASLYREDGKRFKLFSAGKLDPDAIRAPQKVEKLRNDPELRFRFPTGVPLASADTALVAYDNATFAYTPDRAILTAVRAAVHARSRIAVVGANGAGKTTLLKHIVLGDPSGVTAVGDVTRHGGLRVAYVAQHHIDALSQYAGMSPCRFLLARYGAAAGIANEQASRGHLGAFGLGGAVALRPISALSGGQKARLAFAAASLPLDSPPHLLVLDEPTNHLDADATDALTAGLCDFEGAVVLVSHNRGFVTACCSELWVVHEGRVAVTHGEEDADAIEEAFAAYCEKLL